MKQTLLKKLLSSVLVAAVLVSTGTTAFATIGEQTYDVVESSRTLLEEVHAQEDIYVPTEANSGNRDLGVIYESNIQPIHIQTKEIPFEVTAYATQFFNDTGTQIALAAKMNSSALNALKLAPGFIPYNMPNSRVFYFPVILGDNYFALLSVVEELEGPEKYSASISPDDLIYSLNEIQGITTSKNPIRIVRTDAGFAAVSKENNEIKSLKEFVENNVLQTPEEVESRTLKEISSNRILSETTDATLVIDSDTVVAYTGSRNINESAKVSRRFIVPGVTNGSYGSRGMCWAATSMAMYAGYKNQFYISFDSFRKNANAANQSQGLVVGRDGFGAVSAARTLKYLGLNVNGYSSGFRTANIPTYIGTNGKLIYVGYGASDEDGSYGHALLFFGYGYGNNSGRLTVWAMDSNNICRYLKNYNPGNYISYDTMKNNSQWNVRYADASFQLNGMTWTLSGSYML